MKYTGEKIIKALECCADKSGDCANCTFRTDIESCNYLIKISLAIIKRQRSELKKRQWISVKDSLPEKDSRVLVAFRSEKSSDGIEDCYFSGMRNRFVLYHTFEEVPDGITITHWMPLPDPPKGEEHEQQRQTD